MAETPKAIGYVYRLRGLATQLEIAYRNANRISTEFLALGVGDEIPLDANLFEDGMEQLPLTHNDVYLLTYLSNEIKALFEDNNFDKLYRILKASTAPIDWR